MSLCALGDAGGVLAHTHVAAVMGTVFNGVPMSAHGFKETLFVVDGGIGTADLVGIVFLLFEDFPAAQVVPFAPHGDELAAGTQPGFFGG